MTGAGRPRRSGERALLGLLATAAVLALPAHAAAAVRPNLVVASVVPAASSVVAGSSLGLSDATANRGRGPAARTSTALYLSVDGTRSAQDVRLGLHAVSRLRPGRRARVATSFVVPSLLPEGRYFVIACADAKTRVRESRERDNCRAAAAPTAVSVPAVGGQSVGGSGPAQDTPPPADTTPAPDTASAPDTAAPAFVGASGVDQAAERSLRVSWSPAADAMSAEAQLVYLVCWTTTDGGCSGAGFTAMATTAAGAAAYTATGLDPATTYYFVVRARDAAGNADTNDAQRSGTTLADTTAPAFFGAAGVVRPSGMAGSSGLTVSWNAGSDDVTPASQLTYLVCRSTSSGTCISNFTATATASPGATSYTFTGLSASTNYYFVVRARDAAGNVDANTTQVMGTTDCPVHSNGLGQSYVYCSPLSSPSNQATYSLAQANAAANAWATTGAGSGACSSYQAVWRTTATTAAVWIYTGALAGRVYLNTGGTTPICPLATDPTWN